MKPTLCGVVSVLAFSLFFNPSPTLSQEPIKIGFAYVMSGRLAHYGFGAKQGAELAIEKINGAGGINGRRVVGIYRDTQLKPEVGVQVVRELILNEKVDVVMGIVSSGVASAVAPVVNELKTPFIDTLAMTPDITGKICNPYTFRISQNGPQNIKGAAILASGQKAKRWTTLGPDYLFGYQCWEYFKNYLPKLRPDVTFLDDKQIAYAPTEATDLRPYIKKIMDSNPDGVLVSLYGGNLIDFVRQGTELGFFKKVSCVICNLAYSSDVMQSLSVDMPQGIWLGGLYWFRGNESPVNLDFVKEYRARHRIFPDFNAEGAYAGVLAYAKAAELAGSTDKQAIIKALEGLTVDIPAGRTLIRAEDHQAIFDSVWGLTGEFGPGHKMRRFGELKVFSGTDVTPPVEETGCKMPGR
jgi:branched-chain amino acid transport system substrate-binding protein